MYLFLYIDHGYPHLSVRHKKKYTRSIDVLHDFRTLFSFLGISSAALAFKSTLVQLCESFMNETKCADVTEHSTVHALQ